MGNYSEKNEQIMSVHSAERKLFKFIAQSQEHMIL